MTTTQNPKTFLYNVGPINLLTDANWNVRQTYTVTSIAGGLSTVLGRGIPVPPVNVGTRHYPLLESLKAGFDSERTLLDSSGRDFYT